MKVNAEIYVKDIPGQLVKSLEPISTVGGNIMGVVHNRDTVIDGRIGVNITFDVEQKGLDKIKEIWKSNDVIVAKLGSVVETLTMEYMLIGHMSAADIEKMLAEAAKNVSFHSLDVRSASRNGSGDRTAMISAKVHSAEDIKKLDQFLVAACREGALTYVRGLDQ